MPILVLGLAAIVVIVLMVWMAARLPPSFLRRMMFWTIAALIGAATVFAALMGRWGVAIAIIVTAVSTLWRRGRYFRRASQPSDGSASDGPRGKPHLGKMSVDEACQVLGIGQNSTGDEVEAAFRRLMQKVHPDHGGSDWMAAHLTEARSVLMAHLKAQKR